MSTTHIAGMPCILDGRGIQRCAWCGQKLIDTKGLKIQVDEPGMEPPIRFWPPNAVIQVDGVSATVLYENGFVCQEQPNDLCLQLVE